MNSLLAALIALLSRRFAGDLEERTRTFFSASRSSSFAMNPVLCLALLVPVLRAAPAYADGVSTGICNGDYRYGTVTGTGVDTYTFTVLKGGGTFFSLGEVGAHDSTFEPLITVYHPSGAQVLSTYQHYYVNAYYNTLTPGTWTVTVRRWNGGTTGGTYALTLVHMTDPFSISSPNLGNPMSDSVTYSGSITRQNLGIYTFIRTAGGANTTLTLTNNGPTGFLPLVAVFTPSGATLGSCNAPTFTSGHNCTLTTNLGITGTYYAIVYKNDGNDTSGSYTLSATGIVGPPVIGAASGVTGMVTDVTDGGTTPITNGSTVRENDTITTSPGSQVTLTFIDGGTFTLSGNSQLKLDEYVYDPGTNQGQFSFTSWLNGAFESLSGKMTHCGDNVIKTHYGGCCGIRGTQFIARYLYAPDGVTTTGVEVDLIDGTVDTTPDQAPTATFSAPVTVTFNSSGETTAALTQDEYNAIKAQEFLPVASTTTTSSTTTTTIPALCGDVNGDGVVNVGDALGVAQVDVGLRSCGQLAHPEACDVNGDGLCNIGDALKMAQCDVSLIPCAFTCRPFACP